MIRGMRNLWVEISNYLGEAYSRRRQAVCLISMLVAYIYGTFFDPLYKELGAVLAFVFWGMSIICAKPSR